MNSFEIEPKCSTGDISDKCINCLVEPELYNCLIELLRKENEDKELRHKVVMLVNFLRSSKPHGLPDESGEHPVDGKKVILKLHFNDGKPEFTLEVAKINGGK